MYEFYLLHITFLVYKKKSKNKTTKINVEITCGCLAAIILMLHSCSPNIRA